MNARVVLAILTLSSADPNQLTCTVRPNIVQAGDALRLTCHVPRDPHRRLLRYGIEGYLYSERPIDGRITWETLIEHMPCGAGPAYCDVLRDDGRVERVEANVLVAGCDGAEEPDAP